MKGVDCRTGTAGVFVYMRESAALILYVLTSTCVHAHTHGHSYTGIADSA